MSKADWTSEWFSEASPCMPYADTSWLENTLGLEQEGCFLAIAVVRCILFLSLSSACLNNHVLTRRAQGKTRANRSCQRSDGWQFEWLWLFWRARRVAGGIAITREE